MLKLYNLPLILTLIRLFSPIFIILIFYFNFLYQNVYFQILSITFFVLFSLTDFFDGFLARKYNLTSSLGELLDPIADKVLMITSFLCLLKFNQLSLVAVVLLILREVIVTGLRLISAEHGEKIKVIDLGKYKMFAQVVLVCFAVLNFYKITFILEVLSIFLSYYSAYFYLKNFMNGFKEWNLK